MIKLPGKLVELRKHYGYSQNYVSDKLGIEVITYMGYENGRDVPSFSEIKALVKLYKIEIEDLFIEDRKIILDNKVKNNIDKKNYSYLTRQAKKKEMLCFVRKNKKNLVVSASLLIILLLIILIWPKKDHEEPKIIGITNSSDLLDASDTTVVYIDKNENFKGRGDNSNKQLNIDSNDIIKVAEGQTFSVALKKDGKLLSSGLLTRFADEIASLENIIDVELGNGHIVTLDNKGVVHCTGANTYGQCNASKLDNIIEIFADKNATFTKDKNGKITGYGEYIGKNEALEDNIGHISVGDNITAFTKEDKTVGYFADYGKYDETKKWQNIIAVRVGNEFIAALDENGQVFIDIDNYKIKEEVESWRNIKAIASGKDYLVAYDGDNLYGVGNNSYGQFDIAPSQKIQLPSVTNIKTNQDKYNLNITFDEVLNASEYSLQMDAGTGIAFRSQKNNFVIDLFKLEEGKEYTIEIIAIGTDRYENSIGTSITFKYEPIQDIIKEPIINEVEIPFTLDKLEGKTKNSFESYLKGFGVSDEHLIAEESDTKCDGNEAIILSIKGITSYQSLTKSELLAKEIHYIYCKVGE